MPLSYGSRGVKAWTLQADLADPSARGGLVERAVEMAGPVDILVNNASIFPTNTLADMTWQDVTQNMQVNAMAPFLISRSFAAQGRSGAIVNILDTRVVHYDRIHAAYHLSKRALLTLTRMMALEFAPAIRVNAVAPGLILPPPGEDESYMQKMVERRSRCSGWAAPRTSPRPSYTCCAASSSPARCFSSTAAFT